MLSSRKVQVVFIKAWFKNNNILESKLQLALFIIISHRHMNLFTL